MPLTAILLVSTQLMGLSAGHAFRAELLECSNRARVSIQIAPEYFVSSGSIAVRQGGALLRSVLPPPQRILFAGMEEAVYRTRVYLEAGPVRGGAIELEYQGCNEATMTCLPPEIVTLNC